MARTNSPLRYPGGKSCLLGLTADVLRLNGLERGHYAEPYAGGGGLALSLLYGGHVADIHLNDVDRSIWAFWHCVLNETSTFMSLIEETPVTVGEWLKQREVHRNRATADTLALGFSTFFLNRTNRSGIIKGGGVIGGLDQSGSYKIDCRYNKNDLLKRVNRISKYKDRIHIYNLDALDFMDSLDADMPKRSLWFIDPPYYKKGAELYTSFYENKDHLEVATTVSNLRCPWVVTYDDTPEIRHLYKGKKQHTFDISYSVQNKRKGSELLVVSDDISVSTDVAQRQVGMLQQEAA